jgi:hypothetical protein
MNACGSCGTWPRAGCRSTGFNDTLCDLVGRVNERKLQAVEGVQDGTPRWSQNSRKLAAECEERNEIAGTECDCGIYAFNVAAAPVTIVLNAVHCGFEIARGKDMQP